MSTNPFDDPVGLSSASSVGGSSNTGGRRKSQQHHRHNPYHHHHHHHGSKHYHVGGGSNAGGGGGSTAAGCGGFVGGEQQQPPIWAARNVEWPIPSALSMANYQKLLKASKALGKELGITVTVQNSNPADAASCLDSVAEGGGKEGEAAPGAVAAAAASAGAGGAVSGVGLTAQKPDAASSSTAASAPAAGGSSSAGAAAAGGGSSSSSSSNYYGGLTGFMSRVLSTGQGGVGIGGGGSDKAAVDALQSGGGGVGPSKGAGVGGAGAVATHPLRPPRHGCVAAANGWIVAALECAPAAVPSSAGGVSSPLAVGSSSSTTTTAMSTSLEGGMIGASDGTSAAGAGGGGAAYYVAGPVLRLVSRWNVRRGGMADQWMALPPAVTGDGRIVHVFCDPTGSHCLISAANGEAYYLHSSQKQKAAKLAGFGPAADYHSSNSGAGNSGKTSGGSSSAAGGKGGKEPPTWMTGVPASAVAHRRDDASQQAVQRGLSVGSYVTAVAWDKERGTEGSSKTILLGTSAGEIYEYSLVSPSSSAEDRDDARTGTALPVLLHRLYNRETADSTEVGAAVTGLYFERLRTGLMVLAATSGRLKRTRFYTFYSAHSSSFRMVLADQQHASLTELPGSVDFADLRLCNDHFGLRTATGIYYGTIDRSLSGPAVLSGRSSMIVEPGILPYHESSSSSSSSSSHHNIPVSLALTPHHLITLSEKHNEVRFINRVAQKIIQKERVDMSQLVPTSSSASSAGGGTTSSSSSSGSSEEKNIHGILGVGVGELMMDIRRPDQVWLRKGRSLVHISSSQEDRDVWKFTLQKCLDLPAHHHGKRHGGGGGGGGGSSGNRGNSNGGRLAGITATLETAAAPLQLSEEEKAREALFEQAKTLASSAAQKAVVTTVRAEYHLFRGRAQLAAKYLASSPAALEPFADTCVRLALPKLGIDCPDNYDGSVAARESLAASNLPLITYLNDKMLSGRMNDDRMTCTMLGAWLTELYLHERSEQVSAAASLETTTRTTRTTATMATTTTTSDGTSTTATGTREQVEAGQRAMLAKFLNSNVNNMDAKTIMKILTSHDVGAAECSTYAAKSGDIATAVNAALSVGSKDTSGAFDALRILNDAPFELAEPLYYKHATILLARAPMAAGDSFLSRYAQGLSPLRLLPSIMHYEQMRAERARLNKAVQSSSSSSSVLRGAPRGSYASATTGGEENKTSLLDVSVDGPKASNDGFELRIATDGVSKSVSFVDDSAVSAKYLEGVIKQGCRSSAVYSFLISLYAKLEDEEPLLAFLSSQLPAASSVTDATKKAALLSSSSSMSQSGNNRQRNANVDEDLTSSSPLDMSCALRTVLGTGRHFRSAIKLYMGFGMRQQAVELALKVDPSLARELAQDSVELDERKRLWLMIAKNAATDNTAVGSSSSSTRAAAGGRTGRAGKDVVSRVVSVLKDCGPDVLSIEDVLPFLPDFAQIDQIKDEICEALTSYSSKIEGFLREMNEADNMCDTLRDEIGRLRSHRMHVRADARCALTNRPILTAGEPFYVFPSGYVVLATPLKREVLPGLNDRQRARVHELESLIRRGGGGSNREGVSGVAALQTELDGLIAAECPLTGSLMVESIDRPFEDSLEIGEESLHQHQHHSAVSLDRVQV